MTKRFHNILKLNFIYERKKKIVMDDMYISVHSQSQQFMRRIYDLSIAISFQSKFPVICHIHIEFRCDPFGSRLHFNGCVGCWMPNNSVDFFLCFFVLFNKKQSPLAPITTTMKMHSFPTYSFRLCCLNELRNERYRYSVVSKMISLCCWYLLSQRHKIQSLSSHSLYFHLFCFTFSKSIRSDAKKNANHHPLWMKRTMHSTRTRLRLRPRTKTYILIFHRLKSFLLWFFCYCMSIGFKLKSNTEMQFSAERPANKINNVSSTLAIIWWEKCIGSHTNTWIQVKYTK